MRRRLGMVMVSILLTAVLGACGKSGGSDSGGSARASSTVSGKGASSGNTVELKLLSYFSEGETQYDILKKFVDDYHQQNPNVTIKLESAPPADLDQKILQSATAKQVADIIILNYISVDPLHGALVPLTDYVNGDFLSQFYDANVKAGTATDGKVYGVQIAGANDLALFYNKKLLSDAGINPPTTWAELASSAKVLSKDGRYGLAVSATNTVEALWQFEPFFWSNGADFSNVASPEGVEALDFLAQLVKDGAMSKEVVNWAQGQEVDQFVAGNAAMMVNGPWNFKALNDAGIEYGVVTIPVPKAGMKPVVAVGGEVFSLGNTGDEGRTKEAAKFLEYLADSDRYIDLVHGFGYLPSLKAKSDEFKGQFPEYTPFLDQMAYAKPMYDEKGYLKLDKIMQVAIQSALTGQATPKDALDKAAKEIANIQ
ncbi:ABC transporter substrate-binding protein [Cohnella caldifontis]|uniref:ABC transporter substrate-binding protein n=1 Tax=Cohnella caldifontis TaxID=3027471 RepID=UPI0023EDD790|nr:ABC transporter substrate-binding protein [Cohnella sp. YIM B05605]